MAKFQVYSCCVICRAYEVSEEDTEEWPNFRNRGNALMSYRCFKGHMCGATDKVEEIPEGYRQITEQDIKAWETPPRELSDMEFWCRECREVHLLTSELRDKLRAGKYLWIDCLCGGKIRITETNRG